MVNKIRSYYFEEFENCEMCGAPVFGHHVLGRRLNASQGLRPRNLTGITVTVMKCNNCGLVYAQPMPVPVNIEDHYGTPPEEYWTDAYLEYTPEFFGREIDLAKKMLGFRTGMTALDIGTGLGNGMLSLQAAGFDTYGVEASQPFYERAISKYGIDPGRIRLGMVEAMDYPGQFFDFISFGAVLEHLYHPAATIEKVLPWLKKDGLLHIEVPSSNYLISRLINFYYRLRLTDYVSNISPMHVPYHLYEFTPRSFEAVGIKLGFKIEHHFYDNGGIFHFPKFLHPILNKIMTSRKSGMQLAVFLRKTSGN